MSTSPLKRMAKHERRLGLLRKSEAIIARLPPAKRELLAELSLGQIIAAMIVRMADEGDPEAAAWLEGVRAGASEPTSEEAAGVLASLMGDVET